MAVRVRGSGRRCGTNTSSRSRIAASGRFLSIPQRLRTPWVRPYAAGSDPWALEKQSKKLEKQYRDRGEAFLRAAGPGVLIIGVGAASASAAAAGGAVFVAPAVASVAVVTIVALPVYYLSVVGINHHNKKAVMTEFSRRRLPLPLTLAPGETRTGSLFYPMVRSPGSLSLYISSGSGTTTAVLPLEFLHALHVPGVPTVQASH
jgi:hypothetical protein